MERRGISEWFIYGESTTRQQHVAINQGTREMENWGFEVKDIRLKVRQAFELHKHNEKLKTPKQPAQTRTQIIHVNPPTLAARFVTIHACAAR